MWLFVPFLLVPLIEISLFILVGDWLGLWPTLGLVLLAIVAGILVIRLTGVKAVNELRGDMSKLRDPLSPLAHNAMLVLAGGLLILPGFFSDMIAALLLLPPVRNLLITRLGARIKVAGFAAQSHTARSQRDDTITVIDGEYFEVDESAQPNQPSRDPSGWTRH